jgi:hypothetical protein
MIESAGNGICLKRDVTSLWGKISLIKAPGSCQSSVEDA